VGWAAKFEKNKKFRGEKEGKNHDMASEGSKVAQKQGKKIGATPHSALGGENHGAGVQKKNRLCNYHSQCKKLKKNNGKRKRILTRKTKVVTKIFSGSVGKTGKEGIWGGQNLQMGQKKKGKGESKAQGSSAKENQSA